MRRGARIGLWIAGGVVLLVVLVIGWLLYTESGRDYVLQRTLGHDASSPGTLYAASPAAGSGATR